MLPNPPRSSSVRSTAKGSKKPKIEARGPSLAVALAPFTNGNAKLHTTQVAAKLVAVYGTINPKAIGEAQVAFLNGWLNSYANNFSKHRRAGAARRILRYLFEEFGARPLQSKITKVTQPKPRNVTATKDEVSSILAAASPSLRCWLLLCSDTAIRSGTAAMLGPSHYDRAAGVLTFRTKYQNAQQVPVTAALRVLLDTCDDPSLPFVSQLPRGSNHLRGNVPLDPKPTNFNTLSQAFGRLKRSLGITRKLTPHDLRRTTARHVYSLTRDLRIVQALLGHSDLPTTMWYLQDNLVTVPVSMLELAKLPTATKGVQ